jgi:fructan beta-fructosidase
MKAILIALGLAIAAATHAAAADIVIADFEGKDYGDWKVEGTAFGPGPAQGTLPHQMEVSGYAGHGLVNSFFGGDKATGKLTSPDFKIERKFIKFLIGGGGYPDRTCMNLFVRGKRVCTIAGPNVVPGGSEELAPASWDVTQFTGQTAHLEIVDDATGGWGHINVDQIVQSDVPAVAAPKLTTRDRTLTLDKRYLLLPVKNDTKKAPKQRVAVLVDGAIVREFDIDLADQPDWFAHLDVSAWQGKQATLHVTKLPESSQALELVTTSDAIWHVINLYREPLRGQLHFSPRRGWNNDPNGMVFADGEYHLYFQHNPYGWPWGNMHWGHATSPDMVHWREQPEAIYPHQYGDWAFSGSAVVDAANTSGWRTGTNALIVAAYTSTGRGECIVYSNDRGRTFQEFEGNPVLKHSGRDPRLLWHAASHQWVMAVYDEFEKTRCIAFHTSPDLKTWTFQSRIEGFFECPDMFELPLGDKKYWVLTAASSDYMIGQFDGQKFTPETAKLKGQQGRGFYAAQTFSHEPQGRVVQIGWLQTATRGMPFNQSMSLPNELKLLATPEGPRLTWTPVKELEALRARSHLLGPMHLAPGAANPFAGLKGELLEVRAEFAPGDATEVVFTVRGLKIAYDCAKQELAVGDHRVSAPLFDGHQRLIIYVDRTAFEVYASDGLAFIPVATAPDADDQALTLSVEGGTATITALDVHELNSIWPAP